MKIECHGCKKEWDPDFDPCACTCSEPSDPTYEDWEIHEDDE